jgi:hypothetical protein
VADTDPVDVGVDGAPAWVVGVPAAGETTTDSAWAVVADDGTVTGLTLAGRDVERFDLAPGALPSGSPPLLLGGDPPRVAEQPTGEASTITHPVPVESGWLTVADDGDLVLVDRDGGGEVDRLALGAVPDARLVTHEGAAYVLADATDRYRHAVLGDDVEGGSVAVVDVDGGLAERTRIRPPREGVIEGLSPVLADVTGDGAPEVLVTVSNDPGGARLAAYRPDGSRVATSETLSAGWRHQLAVAPFGPDDTPEVAAVRMPHVGHELQFFRRDGEDLQVVGSQDGYQSHTIGSRNLDGALAADLDGDGSPEVLLPTTARDTLAAVRRTDGGAREVWTVPVGGELSTNVAAVNRGGSVTVAAGHEGGVRLWPG